MDTAIIDLWRAALMTAAVVAGPFLGVALAVGLATSLIQAATQMQENVLSFVPKLIAVGLVMAIAGHWILGNLTNYASASMEATVQIAREARQ